MRILATTTVIRGNGACEAYMNGLLNEEVKKMKEHYEKALSVTEAELEAAKGHRDDLLYKHLAEVKAMVAKPTSIFKRIHERIEIAWCMFWYFGKVLKLWGRNME